MTKDLKELVSLIAQDAHAPVALDILKKFPTSQVYLVGGSVRDFFMDRDIKDIDLVVSGVPEAELEEFLHANGHVVLVGKSFGVFAFHEKGSKRQIDIALPRKEKSIGKLGRYKDFEIVADHTLPIEEDLSRRDFTINAMAIDLRLSMLIDPYGGMKDLKAKILRAVGDPAKRFAEDRTRVLRGVRFAVCLHLEIDKKTRETMKKFSLGLEEPEIIIPREVIAKELVKLFQCDAERAVSLLDELGLLTQLFPEVEDMRKTEQSPDYHSEGNVFNHATLALARMKSDEFAKQFGASAGISLELPFATFFHDIGKPKAKRKIEKNGNEHITFYDHPKIGAQITEEILDRLKFASVHGFDVKKISWLISHHMFAITTDLETVKSSTLESYFLKNPAWGEDLLQLIFLDLSGSLRPNGQPPDLSQYISLTNKVDKLRKMIPPDATNIPPLLNGTDLIKEIGIPQGPLIGSLLASVREEQLNGNITTHKQAIDIARQRYAGKHP